MTDLSWIELIYWGFIILGGTFLLLRVVMMFLGGDADVSDAGLDSVEGAFEFKFFSIQGLTAFFLMFGLAGLMLLSAGQPVVITMLGGGLAGLVTMLVIAVLLHQMRHLRSEGTLDMRNAIGEHGSVYLKISAGGSGQVQVVIQGALKVMDAVSSNGEALAYGERVKVVGVADSRTLIVERLLSKGG